MQSITIFLAYYLSIAFAAGIGVAAADACYHSVLIRTRLKRFAHWMQLSWQRLMSLRWENVRMMLTRESIASYFRREIADIRKYEVALVRRLAVNFRLWLTEKYRRTVIATNKILCPLVAAGNRYLADFPAERLTTGARTICQTAGSYARTGAQKSGQAIIATIIFTSKQAVKIFQASGNLGKKARNGIVRQITSLKADAAQPITVIHQLKRRIRKFRIPDMAPEAHSQLAHRGRPNQQSMSSRSKSVYQAFAIVCNFVLIFVRKHIQ